MFSRLDTCRWRTPYPVAVDTMHWLRRTVHDNPRSNGYVWFLQHDPCITRGTRTSSGDIHAPDHIPVYDSSRGGLATYHGPGQLVVYPVVDFGRLGLGLSDWARQLVSICADVCQQWSPAKADYEKMGVYTSAGKIASIGLRAYGSVSIHGVSININLRPNGFQWIDPCGVVAGPVDQIANYHPETGLQSVADAWWHSFVDSFSDI